MTQSLEDYLEVIGNLEEENHNPRVKDIAERLARGWSFTDHVFIIG